MPVGISATYIWRSSSYIFHPVTGIEPAITGRRSRRISTRRATGLPSVGGPKMQRFGQSITPSASSTITSALLLAERTAAVRESGT